MKRKESGNFFRETLSFLQKHLWWFSFAGVCELRRKRDHGAKRRNSFAQSYELQGLRGEKLYIFKGRPARAAHFYKVNFLIFVEWALTLRCRNFETRSGAGHGLHQRGIVDSAIHRPAKNGGLWGNRAGYFFSASSVPAP